MRLKPRAGSHDLNGLHKFGLSGLRSNHLFYEGGLAVTLCHPFKGGHITPKVSGLKSTREFVFNPGSNDVATPLFKIQTCGVRVRTPSPNFRAESSTVIPGGTIHLFAEPIRTVQPRVNGNDSPTPKQNRTPLPTFPSPPKQKNKEKTPPNKLAGVFAPQRWFRPSSFRP